MDQNRPPKPSHLPALLSLVAILFAVQGAWMLAPFVPVSRAAYGSKRWPKTSGRMLSAELSKVASGYDKVRVEVSYEYQVEGKAYRGTQLYPSPVTPSQYRTAAEKLLEQFPAGGTVTVFYAPDDPRNAVLVPGITRGHIGGLIGMAIWVLFPTGLVVRYWVRRWARPSTETQAV